MSGTTVLTEKWPVLGRHEQAAAWLEIWTDLGHAPRTIDAYARGMAEYLLMCERETVDPVTANRAHIAFCVRELTSRPSRRGANVVLWTVTRFGSVEDLVIGPVSARWHDGLSLVWFAKY
ncbi:hypothetical protein [Kitasatospora sp. NPDC092286]|uniref:hypothetical protein n=1 Tax=Kitasatospora sp. NPDC092286 TaxID=3364087 RepID=UPI00381BA017